jgi:hypothetical protein
MDRRLRELERAAQTDPIAFVELALLRNRLGVCGLCGFVKNDEPDSANLFIIIRGQQIAVDQICLAERALLRIEEESRQPDGKKIVRQGIFTRSILEPYPNNEDLSRGSTFWVALTIGRSFFPYAFVVATDPFRAVDRDNNTIRHKTGNLYLHDVWIGFTVHTNKRTTNSHLLTSTRVRAAQDLWREWSRELFISQGRI